MTTITKGKITLTVGYIVSLMILIILIAAGLVFTFVSVLFTSYAGLVIIGSFMLSAVVLGVCTNKVIDKIKQLW